MRARWTLSLRARLSLFALLGTLPALFIILYNTLAQQQVVTAEAGREARNLVRLAIREQERLAAQTRQLLAGLSSHPAILDRGQAGRCQRFLASVLDLHPYYTNLGAAGRDGDIYCSALPLKRRVNIADRRHFQQTLKTSDSSIGEHQIGRITGKSAINMGHPIKAADGTVAGVVFVALDLSWLNQLLARIDLPAGAMLAVIDRRGTVLAHHPDPHRWVGTRPADSPLVRAMLARAGGGTGEFAGVDNVPRLTAYAPLDDRPDSSVYVAAGLATDRIYRQTREILARNLALLGAAVLAVIGAWIGADLSIIKRVNALTAATGRLGRGERGVRTGMPHEGDEIARLACAFDDMAEALERRQAELGRSNRALHTLRAGNRALVRARDEQELLEAMCRAVVRVGEYRMAWVGYAQDNDEKTVRPMAQDGIDEGSLAPLNRLNVSWGDNERGRGPIGTAIRMGAPVIMRDILTDPNFSPWRKEAAARGYAAVVGLPLVIDGRPAGALAIYATEPDAFDEAEMRLLKEMAEDLSYGIATLRTRAQHEQATATIRRLAYFDPLTELPNHAQLRENMREVLHAHGTPHSAALLLIDVRRFRDINEAIGMQQANLLLKALASRLRAALKPDEFLARMRGDEFAILFPRGDAPYAAEVAERVRQSLNERFAVGGLALDVDVSIGITVYPEHGRDVEALLRSAGVALQHAKRSGAAWALYDTAHDHNAARRLALAADLREAIETGSLLLYYQPKVDTRTGRICGAEALTRWHHPHHGPISPDEFIALAEHTGLIGPLTEWVLETAVRQLHDWREAGLRLPVAVNLSARNLLDAALAHKIEALCAQWGIDKGLLELEITESMIMADPARSLALVTALHELGIPLYIDDFGTGYSSLGYLKKLPVDAIKIDKSFVIDMSTSKDSATIVRSIVSLAHALGLKVVAEGVENEAAWRKLKTLRCDVVQGYYVGKPLPAQEFARWVAGWREPLTTQRRCARA